MAGTNRPVIGLVGQICAGKSAVANAFRKLGARVYDADQSVHEIYQRPEVIEEVRRTFGDGVIDSSGHVDRKALAAIVFNDTVSLKRLTETIVFPRTDGSMRRAIEEFRASSAPCLVLDAPTLFEARRAGLCDRVLYVSTPFERRAAWAAKRGWAADELERRAARMGSDAEKRARADAILENAGSLEDVEREVGRLFAAWCGTDE